MSRSIVGSCLVTLVEKRINITIINYSLLLLALLIFNEIGNVRHLIRPTPAQQNQPRRKKEKKNSWRQKIKRADKADNEALTMLLEPSCPTPSATKSLRPLKR